MAPIIFDRYNGANVNSSKQQKGVCKTASISTEKKKHTIELGLNSSRFVALDKPLKSTRSSTP
jgi:hypothetical protein